MTIVFCDLGTPTGSGFNVYAHLREKLVERGMDPTRVKFIHDAPNDRKKALLFEQCRTGQVDVLIGSTSKMGVGTNIQTRAVALHHLDCPWRPADIEQREGRILRQGNLNAEVGIYRYAVEGSFDAYSWQTVERKAKFIDRIMRGSLDQREMEDIGDNTLSFSEVKAIASGDPLILERAEVEQEVTTLTRLERSHARAQSGLRARISLAEREIEQGRHALALGFTHATPAWILIGFLERRSRMTRSTREVASSDYSRTSAPAADWKLLVRVRGRSRSRSILCPRPRQGRRGGAARGQV